MILRKSFALCVYWYLFEKCQIWHFWAYNQNRTKTSYTRLYSVLKTHCLRISVSFHRLHNLISG